MTATEIVPEWALFDARPVHSHISSRSDRTVAGR
jgi:hypothetical protein